MQTDTHSKYHHGNLKDSLIEEALEMIEKDGISSITLRELTKKLGTSRSAVYRHYSSKDDLIKAVIQAGFDKLDATVHPMLLGDGNILDKLYKMGKAYMTFAIQNPNLYRTIFGNEIQKERNESCDINDAKDAPGFHALVGLITQAQELALVKKDDAFMQSTVIWSMMHGISNLLIDGHLHIQENIDELYELTFKTLLRGIAT
jgi:AcrR family transcriptional regulator